MDYKVTRVSDDEELMHYGVVGMRWGHRKAVPTSSIYNKVQSTKASYKQAKKAYNRSYNKAYNYTNAHPIIQFTNKKKKAESDKRWSDAIDKANALDKAKTTYKQAKSDRKNKINATYRDLEKNASFKEKFLYSSGTRKQAAKYVVDNNMSVAQAKKRANKDAIRNTAVLLGAYGAVGAAALYKMNH